MSMKNYNLEMLDAMQTKKIKNLAHDLVEAMREVYTAKGLDNEDEASFINDDTTRAFAELTWSLVKLADGNGHEIVDQYEQMKRQYAELRKLQGLQ